jgi:Chalcone isomerase-like
MKKQILTLILCLMPWLAPAMEIEGVKLAEKARVADAVPELMLNGAGVRTRVVFKVYVGALYLPQKRNAPEAIFSDAGAKRVALHLLRDINAVQLFGALNDGLKANHTPEQLAKIDAQTSEFEGIFKKSPNARTGDVILLDYLPGTGTRVTVNGDAKGVVAGAEFYTALLRVWLGEKPAEAALKKAMLGG